MTSAWDKPQMAGDRIIAAHWRVVFMIGCPIRQTHSPFLFNRHFMSRQDEAVMVPLEVSPEGLAGLLQAIRGASNCVGLVLTLPHKGAAYSLVDRRTARADELKRVNVVRRGRDGSLAGDMVDGPGFWDGLTETRRDLRGSSLALAGAGAAGTAIANEFARRGGRRIALLSKEERDSARLRELVATMDVEIVYGLPDSLAAWDFAVNATPVGMAHMPGTLFPRELLSTMPEHGIVADAITEPERTRLLQEAAGLGLNTVNGKAMTAGQFALLATFLGLGN